MAFIRIDWQTIKQKLGDTTAIYLLTHRQASLILSAIERLEWRATYNDFGYDYSDYDELQLEVADLHHNLTMPVNLVDIIQYIDEIETLLRGLQQIGVCCDDVVPIAPPYQSPNAPNYPGTPPATWGDNEPIADSDDWKELVCGAAHSYVDLLKTTSDELETILTVGIVGLGIIAATLGTLASVGIGAPVAYSAAVAAVSAITAGFTIGIFSDAADYLETARSAIVNAIMCGSPEELALQIETAVGSTLWLMWFQWIDYESAWNTIIDGSNGNGTLPVSRRDDCGSCTQLSGVFVNQVSGFPIPWYSDDDGQTWQSMINHQIVYGTEYRISREQSGTSLAFAFVDSQQAAIDVQAIDISPNYGPGNGLFWSAKKADLTVIESSFSRVTPGDYPFSYPQVFEVACSGNTLVYTTYWLTVTFQEYVP